jgi:uncharacterized OB-fold protein
MTKEVPRYWREIPQRYNLKANECDVCKTVFFPPKISCPKCRRKSLGKMKDKKLSGEGEIITFTIIHIGSEDFENQVPYPIAIIQLDEGPRITAQIIDCETSDVQIGMRVKSTFRKIQQDGNTGAIYYGYKFRLCKNVKCDTSSVLHEEVAYMVG